MIAKPTANVAQLLIYTESIANRLTINSHNFDTKIWLEIPKDIAKDLTLTEVRQLGLTPTVIDIEQNIVREDKKPWIVLNPNGIDKTAGFHMIEFTFRNQAVQDYQQFYFSYTAQVDNPDKPYVYMERTDNT